VRPAGGRASVVQTVRLAQASVTNMRWRCVSTKDTHRRPVCGEPTRAAAPARETCRPEPFDGVPHRPGSHRPSGSAQLQPFG